MEKTPQEEDLKIEFGCQFTLTLPDVRLSTLLAAFTFLLPKILADFIQKALVGYGELLMARRKKPFPCEKFAMMSISSGRPVRASP
jgi:hypothetical protein